ncbi:MAG TPA: S41 family peptidase [Candidatus Dormibacteraeota bacterium]|nr:S41 family peptidase [Candidatus Dormibacteraeota bacterium]
MPMRLRRLLCVAYVVLFALVAFTAHPVVAQTELSAKASQDVDESFHLLEQTAYRQIGAQRIFDAARAGLLAYARKHGANADVPVVRDSGDDAHALSDLDAAIENTAAAAHGDATDYAYAAIAGMAGAFDDRYTEFMTPEEYRAFNEALDPQRISGIGVLVEQDPVSSYIRFAYVLPNTPADRAGLRIGDLLLSVEGTSTKGMPVDGVRNLLRGKAGTPVTIEVASSATATPRSVTMTRSEVQPPTVVFKMLPDGIGYVWVIAFGRATPDEFNVALQRLREQGARALVLDLRNDTGGYVNSALDISSHFVGDQALMTVEERGDRATTYHSDDESQMGLPMTVLVNGYTASASEITAGALQDDGVATLVGTKTFGKGVMQTLTELPDGAAIKITTAHYLTPRHRDINLRGIAPDLTVDENRNARFGELDRDAQLRAAVAYLQRKIASLPR